VVLLGGLVKLAIVYAHTPPCDGALRDEFILIITHYCVTPYFARKTECISYVRQDQNYTHMIDKRV
jgi:hypothetical protein